LLRRVAEGFDELIEEVGDAACDALSATLALKRGG
jgi:hypothetical protein